MAIQVGLGHYDELIFQSPGAIQGDDSNEYFVGGTGTDTIHGGGGNDTIYGDTKNWLGDDDVLDGGSGSDTIYARSGDDIIHYNVTENIGSTDYVDGGSGSDILVLHMTQDQYDAYHENIEDALAVQRTTKPFNFAEVTGGDIQLTIKYIETVIFDVKDAGEPPVAYDDTINAIGEDPSSPLVMYTADLIANDTDPDADINLNSFVVMGGPAHGTLVAHTTGGAITSLDYTPDLNYNGTDSFTYTIEDMQGNTSNIATVNLTVNAINDAPVNAVPTAQTTDQDAALVFSSANGNAIAVSDVDAGDNPIRVALGVNNGTLTLNGVIEGPSGEYSVPGLTFLGSGDGFEDTQVIFTGTITDINTALDGMTFTPDAGYGGTAQLYISTSDQGYSGPPGSLLDYDTVDISVVPFIDHQPVANADSYVTDENITFPGDVSVNDTGLDDTPVNFTLLDSPDHGQVTLYGDGNFMYNPDDEYNGSDSFTYRVTDDDGDFSDATVNITINAINQAPVNTVPDAQAIDQDTTLEFSSAQGTLVAISDVDAGGNDVRVMVAVDSGTLELNGVIAAPDPENPGEFLYSVPGLTFIQGDGHADVSMLFTGTIDAINTALDGMTFTPLAGFAGTVEFEISTNDLGNTGSPGARIDYDTISIDVVGPNPIPVAVDDVAGTGENITFLDYLQDNDTGLDDTPVVYSVVGAGPEHGTLTLYDNGTFWYDPDSGFQGLDTFQYKITDVDNDVSNIATVTISVRNLPGSADTMYVSDTELDLATMPPLAYQHIELQDSGPQNVTLSASDVLAIDGGTLFISGGSGDSVSSDQTWNALPEQPVDVGSTSSDYSIFTLDGATLYIEAGIDTSSLID